MSKKIVKVIAVLFIAGALSGSIKAMENTRNLRDFASTQDGDNQGSLAFPVLLVAGSGAYVFRKEIKAGLKFCLIKSALAAAKVGKRIWDNIEVPKLLPGFLS